MKFGADVDTGKIFELLETAKVLSPYQAQFVLAEKYETLFGLYNHDIPRRDDGLKVVAHHPYEEYRGNGFLDSYLDKFEKYRVFEIISWDQFLLQPKDMADRMIARRMKAAAAVAAELENLPKPPTGA